MRIQKTLYQWLRKRSEGQALVEFALVLPMLMLLLIGAVDFGRAMYAVITVNNAAFHSALWAANHLRQGTTGCGTPGTYCCPTGNNTGAPSNTNPSTIREVVLRDFVVGLDYSSTCGNANDGISSSCNPAVSCTIATDGYTYSGGTAYRYAEVTVTYQWNAIGPYDALVGQINIPRSVRIRKVP